MPARKLIGFLQDSPLFTFLLAAALLASCRNQPEKVHKIGIACGFEAFIGIAEGFKERMAELGYIEGKNVEYDLQKVNPQREADEQAVKKFIDDEVDLILTFTTEASLWTKSLTKGTNLPIVFAMAGIEGNDLVNSVTQPGGNITGVRYPGPDLIVKRFELLRELAPNLKRIWTAYDANYPTNKPAIEMLRQAVSATGATLSEALVTGAQDIQADLQTRAGSDDAGMDAIIMMPDAVSQSGEGWEIIKRFAAAHRIPIAGAGDIEVGASMVLSYTPAPFEIGRQAAGLADKILKGTPAGTIMVATPHSRLRLNYKLAQELGLTVSEGLLSRADEIIR